MGENVVEREGVSVRHPAEFILVGTMNPEEGDLRPQLLDRFDVVVDVEATDDEADRIEITTRREAFDADPTAFADRYREKQAALRERLVDARERLPEIDVPEGVLSDVSLEAVKRRAHGLRADIAVNRIARAIAAFDDEDAVTAAHAREAQYFAFPHRVEGVPEMSFGEGVLGMQEDDEEAEGDESDDETEGDDQTDAAAGGIPIAEDEDSYPVDRTAIEAPKDRRLRERLARRVPSKIDMRSGRYVRARGQEDVDDIALDATIRAAAPHQRRRGGGRDGGLVIEPRDFQQKVRERAARALVVFVVDASGSVMSGRQMLETKRGLLSLIEEAYRTRDRVAVVVFRGESASLYVEPTRNHGMARRAVSRLTVGGNTPLAHGLVEAYELVERERRRDENLYPLVVVLSDGQSNVPLREDSDPREDALRAASLFPEAHVPCVYLDTSYQIDTTPDEIWTERKAERMKQKRLEKNLDVADALNADYIPLATLPRNASLPDDLEVTFA